MPPAFYELIQSDVLTLHVQEKILCNVLPDSGCFLFPSFIFGWGGLSFALQENLNSKSYLSTIKVQVLENLRNIQHAPSVQMQEVSSLENVCILSDSVFDESTLSLT